MQILPKWQEAPAEGKQFPRGRVFTVYVTDRWTYAMTGHDTPQYEEIDRKTSRSICEAVGERLRQSLRPEVVRPSPRLERLIEELRRREH